MSEKPETVSILFECTVFWNSWILTFIHPNICQWIHFEIIWFSRRKLTVISSITRRSLQTRNASWTNHSNSSLQTFAVARLFVTFLLNIYEFKNFFCIFISSRIWTSVISSNVKCRNKTHFHHYRRTTQLQSFKNEI